MKKRIVEKRRVQIGRLALRVEGDKWVAYYAMEGTMSEAIELGSIASGIVSNNEQRKQAFMDLMREIVADLIENATGQRSTWNAPIDAPLHEREKV